MENNETAILGKNIRNLRIFKGMSQKSLAEATFTSRNTIYLWESGEKKPSKSELRRIAELFDVSVESLVNEPDLKLVGEAKLLPSIDKISRSASVLDEAQKEITEAVDALIVQMDNQIIREQQKKKDIKEIVIILIVAVSIMISMFILYCTHVNKPKNSGSLQAGTINIEELNNLDTGGGGEFCT